MRRAMVFASTKVEGGRHLLRNRLCRSSKSTKAKTNGGGRSLRMINQIGNDGRKSKRIKEEKREEERIAVVVVVIDTGVV